MSISSRASALATVRSTLLAGGCVVATCFMMAGPTAAAGKFDGTWNVTFTPRAGNCSQSYSAPFIVSGRNVASGGGGKVTGGVKPNGMVEVTVSIGLSNAVGKGKLAGRAGAGQWNGLIQGDRCSGVWIATRD